MTKRLFFRSSPSWKTPAMPWVVFARLRYALGHNGHAASKRHFPAIPGAAAHFFFGPSLDILVQACARLRYALGHNGPGLPKSTGYVGFCQLMAGVGKYLVGLVHFDQLSQMEIGRTL